MNHKLKVLVGMLTVGTVFPACQKSETEMKKNGAIEKTELCSKVGAEINPTLDKTAATPWVVIDGEFKYQIIKAGNSNAKEAVKGDMVKVHYTGWLNDNGKPGKKFDSSLDRKDPFTFPLGAGRVIQGWDKGVLGMKIGEQRRLNIPAEYGYGKSGFPPVIPQNATLIFDVELLEIC